MAQLDRPQRRESPRTTPNPPAIEQLFREGEASRWSPARRREAEEENGHQCHQKKSVLTKVKEKAKKLKHSLSLKKKHSEHNVDNIATPSWGVSLEDGSGEEEEDAEYLGAPMYESEFAPESYKVTARQHPRTVPVTSEKHVVLTSTAEKEANPDEKLPSPDDKSNRTKSDDKQSNPSKTIVSETAGQKRQTPALDTVTEKIGNSPTSEPSHNNNNIDIKSSPLPSRITTSPQKSAPLQPESAILDKGVSVKDYLLNKFEPAEEDRALSRAISKAMASPRSAMKNSSDSAGNGSGTDQPSVVEKVRQAVASLLRNDQPRSPPSPSPSPSKPAALTRTVTKTSMPRHIPGSTNARHEAEEEENHGRTLQTN